MYMLFVDESGTLPTPAKAVGSYLTIAGVIIPESAWHGIASEFAKIRRSYCIAGEVQWKFFSTGMRTIAELLLVALL